MRRQVKTNDRKEVRGCNEQEGKSIPTRACYLIQVCSAQETRTSLSSEW